MIVMKFGGTSVEDARAIERVAAIVKGQAWRKSLWLLSAPWLESQILCSPWHARQAPENERLRSSYADPSKSGTTIPRVNCWARLCLPIFIRRLGPISKALMSCCAVSPPWARLPPRTTDHVASFGEILSSKIVAAAFSALGLNGVYVDAREVLVTDSTYMQAVPQLPETSERLQSRVKPLLDAGKVPVMGGFVGANQAGITTTIGRGGSDFSAALVGAGLDAERIEIWTDVDGILTTDPRICPDARRIRVISFDEAAELAYFGAKVLHPATVLPAIHKNIPVYVLNSLNPSCEGTKITTRAPQGNNIFKAIAAKKRITIVGCGSAAHALGARFPARDFRSL